MTLPTPHGNSRPSTDCGGMVSDKATLPIVERLRKRIVPDNLLASMDEAADTIEALYGALDQLHREVLYFLKRDGKEPGKTGPGRALYDTVESALALVRGESTHD